VVHDVANAHSSHELNPTPGICWGMFIFGWPGKWGGVIRWQQGSAPHGSARGKRPQQHSHQARSTGADEVLVAAHTAGHAGRVPLRLRHVEYRIGAELRPLP